MEKEIKDGFNFLLGAYTTVKTETESAIQNLEKEFKALAEKGAQDNSETSVTLRKYFQEALTQLEKISGEVSSKVEEVKSKVKPSA